MASGIKDWDAFLKQVRADLKAAGFPEAADRLAYVQTTSFTSGSEYLGELGLAVKEIREGHRIAPELDAKLEQIMAQVRRAWPKL